MGNINVLLGVNNPVTIVVSGVDLTSFTDISVSLGGDTRTLLLNPASVVVESSSELKLCFNDTTETGNPYWEIVCFNEQYPEGFEITSRRLNNLSSTSII